MHRCASAVSALCKFVGRSGAVGVCTRCDDRIQHRRRQGGGYARYLESKTVEPERGDYYLDPDGETTQAPGRWLASPDTLARLGIEGSTVEGRDFISLMEGRHPRSGRWLRPPAPAAAAAAGST